MYRPLSPHILIYKPQLNSMLSVIHRMTAIILSIALLVFYILTTCSGYYMNYYPIYKFICFLHVNAIWFFIGCLVIILLSFFYHMSNGIRHLIWDFSSKHYLEKSHLNFSGYIIIFSSIFLTSIFLLAMS